MFKFIRVKKEDTALMNKIFRFRYKILCDELKFFDKKMYPDGLEKDEYDKYAIEYVVLDEKSDVVATVRLIFNSPIGYPTQNHMKIYEEIEKGFNKNSLGEISRIFISKEYRNLKDTKKIIKSLIEMIYLDLKKNNVEYSLGALELSFLRLLRIFGIKYEIIGELQHYGNKRYPCLLYTSVLEKYNPKLLKLWKEKKIDI
ncbi:MAG TPA: GNAT family N-acetyltransferase [Campylobacterales bacterium]|nr:GNAT family N-acetyltransferase [Campylobacterales bacterium]